MHTFGTFGIQVDGGNGNIGRYGLYSVADWLACDAVVRRVIGHQVSDWPPHRSSCRARPMAKSPHPNGM